MKVAAEEEPRIEPFKPKYDSLYHTAVTGCLSLLGALIERGCISRARKTEDEIQKITAAPKIEALKLVSWASKISVLTTNPQARSKAIL